MPSGNPVSQRLERNIPAQATAGTAQTTLIGEAQVAGVVSSVSFSSATGGITGVATNNRVFTLVNKGQDGTGTNAVAAITWASGTSVAAYDEKALTLSGTAANLVVAEGDELALVETVNGSGLASPGGVVQVEITRS